MFHNTIFRKIYYKGEFVTWVLSFFTWDSDKIYIRKSFVALPTCVVLGRISDEHVKMQTHLQQSLHNTTGDGGGGSSSCGSRSVLVHLVYL